MSDAVAVVLSGCGVFDGTEIHEISAVCAALSRAGKKIGWESAQLCQYVFKYQQFCASYRVCKCKLDKLIMVLYMVTASYVTQIASVTTKP